MGNKTLRVVQTFWKSRENNDDKKVSWPGTPTTNKNEK